MSLELFAVRAVVVSDEAEVQGFANTVPLPARVVEFATCKFSERRESVDLSACDVEYFESEGYGIERYILRCQQPLIGKQLYEELLAAIYTISSLYDECVIVKLRLEIPGVVFTPEVKEEGFDL